MDTSEQAAVSMSQACWQEVALLAINSMPVKCPVCGAVAVTAAWHLTSLRSRSAVVDLKCAECSVSESTTIALPLDAPSFSPLDRFPLASKAVEQEMATLGERIQRYTDTMPIAAFTTNPLWATAGWSGTTFRWHPKSEAPPVMGLVFDDAEAGKEIFRGLEKAYNHTDRFEEMRISIIEGSPINMPFGYTVHLCPNADAIGMDEIAGDHVIDPTAISFLGRWNRVYPKPGSPPLLPKFKEEFRKHGEFLLAPVTQKAGGQLHFDSSLGFIKHSIEFRQLTEIQVAGDIDAFALAMPLVMQHQK